LLFPADRSRVPGAKLGREAHDGRALSPHTAGMRREHGQTAAEYLGILFVVAAIIAALLPGPGAEIAGRITRLVNCVGSGGCAAASGGPGRSVSVAGANGPAGPRAAQAAVPTPVVTPDAPPAPAVAWMGQAANLPRGGDRPYVPPKKSRGQPKKVPLDNRGGKTGYEDADGNRWEWVPEGSGAAHGGPHWDVQHKDGSHTNVYPDGHIRGEDNFPNKPRSPEPGDDGSSRKDNTAKAVVGGAAAGAIIWWGAKLLSPACGPFAPVCVIAF
jgi:hypothetical protein